MTEREKMINGALYDPSDPELEQLRLNARKLARKYNRTDEDQPEEQAEILRKLLPATKQFPYLQAPVYFDRTDRHDDLAALQTVRQRTRHHGRDRSEEHTSELQSH